MEGIGAVPRKLVKALQFVAVLAGLGLAPLWCVVAFLLVPWIVPADSVGAAGGYGPASRFALGLALVSLASVVLASGVFANRRSRWAVAAVLLASHTLAACYLYPYPELSDRGAVVCLTCQEVSVGLILIGAVCGVPEPPA
jgi:hypothetical protein